MSVITIYALNSHIVLYEGHFSSLRHCVEAAIKDNTSLRGADLRSAHLVRACMDGADLRDTALDGACLLDANLSEANLTGASLIASDLTQTCLCESRIVNVNFRGASFCGALITGALIDGCLFSCPSTFSLPFAQAQLGANIFMPDGETDALTFTAPPVVVTGLPERLVFLDDAALVGSRLIRAGKAPFALPEQLKSFAKQAMH